MNRLNMALTNSARTENGAITHKSTLDPVLDFFYHASARRGKDNTKLFADAYAENKIESLLVAFYTRDVRGGQGERNTFRQILNYLYANDRSMFHRIMHLVPEYGRWDDLLSFHTDRKVVEFVRATLNTDYTSKKPSLLAKWMPSENTSSKTTVALARAWITALETTPKHYRRRLTKIRATIKIVESQMSAGNWSGINYSHVPSKASMLYRKAFSKRDGVRYSAYLEAVKAGKTKINSATLYPYEIVEKFVNGNSDNTLEELWRALPDYVNGKNAMVICDTSGSMLSRYIPNTPTPISVAISLAIYFAERSKGPFKDTWINFNTTAKAYKLTGKTLYTRVQAMVNNNDWGGSTNLQSAFDLILKTAEQYNVPAEDMPEMLFVVSDMQFNPSGMLTNFDAMKRKYEFAGYTIPTIVFWNVASRVNEAPVTRDTTGAYLVSGCSPSIFKAALNTAALTPRDMMLDVLNNDRYAAVREAINA